MTTPFSQKSDDIQSGNHTLLYQTHSPFARKALVFALECGLGDRIEVIHQETSPTNRNDRVFRANPLGKVPVLILENGATIFDSPVIIDFLNQMGRGPDLFAHEELPVHELRTLFALSNGVLDAALLSVLELRRPEQEQSVMWLERWRENILAGVGLMAQRFAQLGTQDNMASLSFGVALDYLMFRLPDIDWRTRHPDLTIWAAEQLKRPVFTNTDPRQST